MPRIVIMIAVLVAAVCQGGEPAKDSSVPGFVKPAPNEHPRLFFRTTDLDKLKARAATSEGKQIIARLRFQLDSGAGNTLPAKRNPLPAGNDPGDLMSEPVGKVFTIFHAVGYGMLWHLTGDKAAADAAREAAILVAHGQSDRDARFGLKAPAGGEYSGAAVAALAMAYDLCYDVWSDEVRTQIFQALTAEVMMTCSGSAKILYGLAFAGDTLGSQPLRLVIPATDHIYTITSEFAQISPYGVGGRDNDLTDALRDVTLPLAIQSLRVAGGVDLAKIQPKIQTLVDRLLWLAMPARCGLQLVVPYDHAPMGSQHLNRIELAGGGQFVQAMGIASPDRRAALRWVYEHFCVSTLGRDFPSSGVKDGQNDFDTVGPYPHRSMLALINWPFEEPARYPGEVLPAHVQVGSTRIDSKAFSTLMMRNAWSGPDDILVAFMLTHDDPNKNRSLATATNPSGRCRIWAHGRRYMFNFLGATGFAGGVPGEIIRMNEVSDKRWLVHFSRDESKAPRIMIDLNRSGSIDGVVITQGPQIVGDFGDADRVSRFDLTGDWSCSRELAIHLDQQGEQFIIAADNPWGHGKTVVGTIAGDRLSLNLANGLFRGRLAPHGHVIAWSDGAVWRRRQSPLELPQSLTPTAGDRTLVRVGQTREGIEQYAKSALINVLTCSPTGEHPEMAVIDNGLTIGERTFLFPALPPPKPPEPRPVDAKKPTVDAAAHAPAVKAPAVKAPAANVESANAGPVKK
ncbi:hypothetical protein LBMAG53_20100 [Planctomycetota bacterium]|nr:hypothetical protein LBMAG53_20100 [Planctomycetota bacterium]